MRADSFVRRTLFLAGLLTCVVVPSGAAAFARGTSPSALLGGAPPVVSKLLPKKGPAAGGTAVTITGSGFTGASAVSFGGIPSPQFEVTSDSTIVAVSPGETSGSIFVTVTTDGGTSAATNKSKYAFERPTVTAVAPAKGSTAGGAKLTIEGTGFALGEATAFHVGKGLALQVNCVSSTVCSAMVPAAVKVGTVDVVAKVGGKGSRKVLGDQFQYITPAEALEIQEREELEAKERQELKEREEREARERVELEERERREREEREARERVEREERERREREEHAPSISASRGGPDRGGFDLNIAVHNFPTGTFTYFCHDNSGPGGGDTVFFQHAVTVTSPNQSSWPGVFCFDSAPFVAYLVMDGVRSNSVQF
jgi:hypothetical protein